MDRKSPLLPPQATITDLWHRSSKAILLCDPDSQAPGEVVVYDQVLSASSVEFTFDLAELGFPGSRWTKLVRQYLPVSPTLQFVDRAGQVLRGESKPGAIVGLLTRPAHSFFGNCIQSFTFRGQRASAESPVLTMHSRTSYAGYMAGLDLALANKLAEEVASRADIPATSIAFRWVIDSLQLNAMRSIPYFLTRSYFRSTVDDKVLRATCPGVKNAHAALRTLDSSAAQWGPGRRVYKIFKGCTRRSTPIESLSLDCLCRVS